MPKAFVVMNAEFKSENCHVNNLKKPNSLSLPGLKNSRHRRASRSIHDVKMKETITWRFNDFFNFIGRSNL
jgi:hypothetical protein